VAARTIQAAVDKPGRVNALLLTSRDDSGLATEQKHSDPLLKPQLADFGLKLERTKRGYEQLVSDRMLLEPAAERAALEAYGGYPYQIALTYLANTIAARGKAIPYSTIAAIDFTAEPPLGPMTTTEGDPARPLADDEIALNAWAAEDLGVRVGDSIGVTTFEPESTHGQLRETTTQFRLAAILKLEGAAADPQLTPELPGVTDQLSMGDWDPPFPFEAARVRKKDDQYWYQYRATPKAFVSLAAGKKLWGSRFGSATAMRFVPPQGATLDELAAKLRIEPEALGFTVANVHETALEASRGTTPFNVLFLAFSSFVVTAAVMLIALLFRLGIDRRAEEIGTLLAAGMRVRRVAALMMLEGLLVTLAGSALGVAGGVAYAWLMLAGLRTWWLEAVRTPFLQLWVAPSSLVLGFLLGSLVSLVTIAVSCRRLRRVSVRGLLAGQIEDATFAPRQRSGWSLAMGTALIVGAGAAAFAGYGRSGEAQAGAFFAAGALVLSACLVLLWGRLRTSGASSTEFATTFPLTRLAARNAQRHPGRSLLTVGLIAAASFLIVAMSAFRLDPAEESRGRDSGTGGYTLIAQSDQPIYQDLSTKLGQEELGFSEQNRRALAGASVVALRMHPGDDASCLNLYQPTQPRILGVPAAMIRRGGFAWQAAGGQSPAEQKNPWAMLARKLPPAPDGTPIVPVVLDANTAIYSLHLWGGVGESLTVTDGSGRPLRLQVVGLLKNSIFQGDVLMDEHALLRYFPGVSGYSVLLVDAPPERVAFIQQALEEALAPYGLDAQPTIDRLAGFLAVQNTYLSTFQSLGGLGLLLGTFGLAVVQMRSVLERRGELALMRAAGFRRARLALLVLLENMVILACGLGVGILAALVAVSPHLLTRSATIPWLSLAWIMLVVIAFGFIAASLAVRFALRAQLIPALRGQ